MGRTWRSEPGAGHLAHAHRAAGRRARARRAVAALRAARSRRRSTRSPATRVRLKWPNDLYVGGESSPASSSRRAGAARRPDWVAIGFGINVRAPALETRAIGLRAGASRRSTRSRASCRRCARAASRPGPLTRRRARRVRRARPGRRPARRRARRRDSCAGIDASGRACSSSQSGRHRLDRASQPGSLVLRRGAS